MSIRIYDVNKETVQALVELNEISEIAEENKQVVDHAIEHWHDIHLDAILYNVSNADVLQMQTCCPSDLAVYVAERMEELN